MANIDGGDRRRGGRGSIPWGRCMNLPRKGGLVALVLTACVLGMPLEPAATDIPSSPEWRIEPLGPDGADVQSLVHLNGDYWLSLTARRELMLWTPSPCAFGDGAWESIGLGDGGSVIALAETTPGQRVVMLLGNGAVLQWSWEAGGQRREDWVEQLAWEWKKRGGPGELALAGWIAPDVARRVVAMLPAGRRAPEGALFLTRDQECILAKPDGTWVKWTAEFYASAPDPQSRLDVRLRGASVMPAFPRHMWALTEWEGLFLSRDGGRTFFPVAGGLPKAVRALAGCAGGKPIAVCPDGIYHCRDSLNCWDRSPSSDGLCWGEDVRCAEIDPREPDRIWVITQSGRLQLSRDRGRTWNLLFGDRPFRVRALAWDESGTRCLLATSRGVRCSVDGGTTWTWRNRGLRQVTVRSIAVDPESRGLYLGTDLGFYACPGSTAEWISPATSGDTDSGDAWACLGGCVTTVSCSPLPGGGGLLCAGGEDGTALCRWSGVQPAGLSGWQVTHAGRSTGAVLALSDGTAWAAGRHGGVLWAGCHPEPEARDDWVRQTSGASAGLSVLIPDPRQGSGVIFLAEGEAVRLPAEDPRPIGLPPGRDALSILVSGEDLWVGTDDGLFRENAVNGWTLIAFAGARVSELRHAARRPEVMLARTPRDLYWSRNGGETWSPVPLPDELTPSHTGVDPDGRRIYVGTRFGLFAALPPDEDLMIARPLPVEAHPNPFSTQVRLRCQGLTHPERDLQEAAAVGESAEVVDGPLTTEPELRIISVHGQLVRRLGGAEPVVEASGTRFLQWTWDGRTERGQEAPNGIYLLSTRVGEQGYVGKVVKFR